MEELPASHTRQGTIALSTGSLHSYGLSRVFDMAREAGFEAVEVMVDGRWDTRHPEYLKELSHQFELPIACLHSPFVSHVPGWRHSQINRLKETVAIAKRVGAGTVVAHLPVRWTRASLHLPLWGRHSLELSLQLPVIGDGEYPKFLREGLDDFQRSTPVKVAVENMPYQRWWGRAVSAYRMNTLDDLEMFTHLNFDTTHMGTAGIDIIAAYERLSDRIVHVHLSNYENGQEHKLLTDGVLPLEKLLQRMHADGYDGVISVEVEPGALEAGSERKARQNLRKCYEFCRKHFPFAESRQEPNAMARSVEADRGAGLKPSMV